MTARDDLDGVLGEWFAAAAQGATPSGLHDAAVLRVRSTRQRPTWLARIRQPGPAARPMAGVLIPVTAVVVLVGIAIAWGAAFGGVAPTPAVTASPTSSATSSPDATASGQADGSASFIVPFTYAIPPDSGLVPAAGGAEQRRIAWVVGEEAPTPSQTYGGQAPDSGVTRGIVVAAAERPWAHSTGGRYYLHTSPAALLDDLAGTSGADLGPITPVRLGGQPALATTVASYGQNDIHLNGGLTGLVGSAPDSIGLGDPCRLVLANVGGQVVFVLAWARTQTELDAFLPTASQFVDSIRFLDVPEPSAAPSPIASFLRPFTYSIPAGSGLRPAGGSHTENMIGWVVGPDIAAGNVAYGGQDLRTGNTSGIIVAAGERPWSHAGDRYYLRTEPAELLADLRDRSGVHLGAFSDTELDGRPALNATKDDHTGTDIHVSGPITGLPTAFVSIAEPSRLIVAKVDGVTVIVVIWAHTKEALDAFQPAANAFVDSIQFTSRQP